jgi:hypothetical protein
VTVLNILNILINILLAIFNTTLLAVWQESCAIAPLVVLLIERSISKWGVYLTSWSGSFHTRSLREWVHHSRK